MKRVVIYARVSTDEQAEEGHSIDAQIRLCRELCARKGWDVVAEYIDPGISGTTTIRPAFQDMLRDSRLGKFEIIVVHKLDRFSRSLVDTLTTLSQLSQRSVSLCSASEDFDFTTPIGRVLLALLVAFAQYFIDNLRAETKKGLRERTLKGFYNGTLPYGYQRVPKEQGGIPIHHPKNLKGYRLAVRLCLRGYNLREIADELNGAGYRTSGNRGENLFLPDNIADMLRTRFHLGMVSYKSVWRPGKHQPAIDEETWNAVQIKLNERSSRRDRDNANLNVRIYPLRKLLHCTRCGEPLRGQPSRVGVRKYKDMQSAHRRCAQPQTVHAEPVEKQLRDLLHAATLPPDWKEQILNRIGAGTDKHREEERRKRLVNELARARKLYIAGDLPDGEYEKEKKRIQVQLDTLKPTATPDFDKLAETLNAAGDLWDKATDLEKMQLARSIFTKVWLEDKDIVGVEPRPAFYNLMVLAAQKTSPPGKPDGDERAGGSDGGRSPERAPTSLSEHFYLPRIIVIVPPGSAFPAKIGTNEPDALKPS